MVPKGNLTGLTLVINKEFGILLVVKTMAEENKEIEDEEFGLNLEDMLRAGLHFGHRASKLHPKMEPFVYGVKKTVHIINLEKTQKKLKEALGFVRQIGKEGKILLLVGTKMPHKEIVKNTAIECNLPYVIERWLGGTLTNFQTMRKRIEHLKEIQIKQKSGELEKYTKKERADIEKEVSGLDRKFGGSIAMEQLPDAIFVCDMVKDRLAIKEARMKKIPVIAICDSNADPTLADYPIPANDDAISSVRYILEKVKEAILKAKPEVLKDKKSQIPNSK